VGHTEVCVGHTQVCMGHTEVCLGHTQVCAQKDLFISVDSLKRKILSSLNVKVGILFIIITFFYSILNYSSSQFLYQSIAACLLSCDPRGPLK
jgi:hypothetical protein